MFLRLFSFLSLLATFCVLYQSSHISAQEVSDYKSSLDVSAVQVGEQVVLKLSFTTPKEVNSELDLSSNSWGELEIIEGTGKQIKFIDPRQPLVQFKRNFYRVKVVE